MNLKGIDTETMLTLSKSWLEPAPDGHREALEQTARLVPYLSDLESVRKSLLDGLRVGRDDSAEAESIRLKLVAIDEVHDRMARGASLILQGLREIAHGDEAAQYDDLLTLLLPAGLAFVNKPYRAEAGNAQSVRSRLDAEPGLMTELQKLGLPGGRTMADIVLAWLDAGDELGRLEVKRDRIKADLEKQNAAIEPKALLNARNRWIRVVSSMVTAIELDDPIPDVIDVAVMRPLLEAVAKTDKRASSKADPAPAPAPAAPADPTDGV